MWKQNSDGPLLSAKSKNVLVYCCQPKNDDFSRIRRRTSLGVQSCHEFAAGPARHCR